MDEKTLTMILSFLRLLLGLPKANTQPNISLVFVSLSSCKPNKKLLGLILVLVRPLEPLIFGFRPLLGLILAL